MSAAGSATPSRSLLALGGLLLAAFALVFAGLTLFLALVAPSPILLVLPFLFGPLSLVGGVLAGLGRRRVRRSGGALRGARTGLAGVLVAAVTLVVMLPASVGLGLPRFRAYQLESREAEALHFISQIRMGAMSHRHEGGSGRFFVADSGWTPAAPPTSRRYAYDAALWREEPWASLDFAPSTAHFHQYRYRALEGGRGFVVAARGDLDGDGVLATYTATVHVRSDGRVERDGPTRSPLSAR